MRNSLSISEKLAWLATMFLLSSITIFESYTWGKYILILECIFIACMDVFLYRGCYRFSFGKYHFFVISLTIYTAISSLWAINTRDSIIKTITYVQILACMSVVYNHFSKYDNVDQMLSIVKWASYVLSVYSIWFYGLDFVTNMMINGVRLTNSFTNINSIGMIAAFGIIIQIDEILVDKALNLPAIFIIPSFMMVFATQSRKALLILIAGTLLVFITRTTNNKNVINNILTGILILLVGIIVIRLLSSLEIFQGINTRMNYLVAIITGKGNAGYSTRLRQQLIEVGIDQFVKTPLLGIGIGCPHIIAASVLNYDAYLHNGFIEILVGGGLAGFLIYYSSFAYLLHSYYKYKHYGDDASKLVIILIVISFFRDFAMVSVYDKSTYFYFVIFFLMVKNMKSRYQYYASKEAA